MYLDTIALIRRWGGLSFLSEVMGAEVCADKAKVRAHLVMILDGAQIDIGAGFNAEHTHSADVDDLAGMVADFGAPGARLLRLGTDLFSVRGDDLDYVVAQIEDVAALLHPIAAMVALAAGIDPTGDYSARRLVRC